MSPGESNRRVKVVLFGLGTVGRATLRLCRRREWIDPVGAVVRRNAPRENFPDAPDGFVLSANADEMLETTTPDVALIATRPTVAEVLPDIERCVRRGINVICTSEELAYPAIAAGETGLALDSVAKGAGVVIAATGINPGFIFDALPLALAGGAWDVERLSISRTLDASVFGRDVHRSLGVGYEPEAFAAALAAHTIRGHIGFEESANVIAHAMGRAVERFEEHVEPVYTDEPHVLADYRIEPGQSAGVTQRAVAWAGGAPWLEFDLSLHVAPQTIGLEPRDTIRIEGENTLRLTIEPGTQAVLTTAARLVNTIPSVLAAKPGLYGAADLLPAAPWLGAELPPHPKSN